MKDLNKMEKPYKYTAIHKVSKKIEYFNIIELRPDRIKYYFADETEYPWIILEDIRYKAKLRLYNYVNKIPKQKPYYAGTEIGKSIPILNF